MNKFKQFIGIDISKDVFDVSLSEKAHHQFTNDTKGFIKFKKLIGKGSLCVMESTGVYHQGLALFLRYQVPFLFSIMPVDGIDFKLSGRFTYAFVKT